VIPPLAAAILTQTTVENEVSVINRPS
jgi:hypothetical protein